MEYEQWEPIYREILSSFGYPREADERAAWLLSELLAAHPARRAPLSLFRSLFSGQRVAVVGAAPWLEEKLASDAARWFEEADVTVVADGAVGVVTSFGLVPDVIVTDLDGDIGAQCWSQRQGSILVVHAHGDNIEALQAVVPALGDRIVGTTQSVPVEGVYNFGGFTDGDRAVCLADHFGAGTIVLVGFDFETPRLKAGGDLALKRRKLEWARRIIEGVDRGHIAFAPC